MILLSFLRGSPYPAPQGYDSRSIPAVAFLLLPPSTASCGHHSGVIHRHPAAWYFTTPSHTSGQQPTERDPNTTPKSVLNHKIDCGLPGGSKGGRLRTAFGSSPITAGGGRGKPCGLSVLPRLRNVAPAVALSLLRLGASWKRLGRGFARIMLQLFKFDPVVSFQKECAYCRVSKQYANLQ